MKVASFLLMLCFVFLSAIPVKAKDRCVSMKEKHCHKMAAKQSPCNPSPKNNCGQGMCNTLSCTSCGYLKTDPILVDAVIPVLTESQFIPYHIGALSGYSMINWNPPKI